MILASMEDRFIITTERLKIRFVEPEDFDYLIHLSLEPEVEKYSLPETDLHLVTENTIKYTELSLKYHRGFHETFIICLKDSETPIGSCSIWKNPHCYEMSCMGWSFSTEYHGQGYATESLREMLHYAFRVYRPLYFRADSYRDNVANIRVMEKIGLKRTRNILAKIELFFAYWRYKEWRRKVRYEIDAHAYKKLLAKEGREKQTN